MRSALTRISAIITDLVLLHPTNLEEEKRKFFADERYNPRFTYRKTDFPLLAFRDDLERYLQEPQDEDERISGLVQERVRELLLWLQLHEQKGKEGFTDVSLKLYGAPSPRLVRQALETLRGAREECPADRTLSAEDVKPRMEAALRVEGLDWDVVIKDGMLNRMHVIKGKELRINRDATFSEQDVQKLLVHEVRTHARRFKNGQEQDNSIFETGTAHFLETEEGLATYNEDRAGLLSTRVKRNLAARVVAVDKALHGSFSDVYTVLEPLVGENKAFELAVNVKRGLSDTSKPGAFTKAYLYYAGWQKVQALSEEDRKLLYVGKISFLHLPLIKELVQEGKVRLPP